MKLHLFPRRLFALGLGALLAVTLIPGCATLAGPRSLRLSESELTQLLARHFPYEKRVLEIFDVRLGAPRLTLMPDANRLANDLPIEVTDRLLRRTYTGSMALDYHLRYDAQAQVVRLDQVHVGRLTLDGVPAPVRPILDGLGPLLAQRLLDDVVVYRVKPADLQQAQGLGYQPGDLTVTASGVEMALNPAR